MTAARRTRTPEATRAQIVDAAIETIQEMGAAHFTLDAVVSRLALSKGALLHHFPSKTALLEGVLDHLARAFVAEVKAEAALDPEPYGRDARAYLRATIKGSPHFPPAGVGKVVLAACLMEPNLAARWQSFVSEITADDPTDPVGADDALILRLVADGLWLSDVFGMDNIAPDQRRALMSILTPAPAAATRKLSVFG